MEKIVGVDEAGRGPLAGSVVAVALYLKTDFTFAIKDSKELSAKKREEIFCWLLENSIFSVAISTAEEIDRLNILEATFLAFERAIVNLLSKEPTLKDAKFIIDGPHFKTNLKINYTCVVKADKKIASVASASIVAKVVRDYLMDVASSIFNQWNFSKHKGYPTKEHLSLIAKYSLSPLHRKSFAPCVKFRS